MSFPSLPPGHARLSSRILTRTSEHEEFARTFEALGGNRIPIEYLRQSQVRGFFRGAELVAGYALNKKAPFRYASWIPDEPRADIERRGFLVEPTSAELTCIWMRKGKLTKLQRNGVYVQSTVDAFRSGKTLIFGGSRIPAVARIQKRALPYSIYAGNGTFSGSCEIYYASRYMMLMHISIAAAATYSKDLIRIGVRSLRSLGQRAAPGSSKHVSRR